MHGMESTSAIAQAPVSPKALASTIAGSWYPGTPDAIRAMAEIWERRHGSAKPETGAAPNVVILPHAGWAYSGDIAWQAVRRLRGARFRRVVILAPSHRAWIENRLVAPASAAVSTPLGAIPVDRDGLDRLALLAPVVRNDSVHAAEHAAQIEYPLLQLALHDGFSVLPLVMGAFGRDQMEMSARALASLADAETLLAVSSDFTHYGDDFSYSPYGAKGDAAVRERVAAADADALSAIARCDADAFVGSAGRTGATICGRVPIELALRALPHGTSLARLAYATSGDGERDWTRFVCYAALAGRAEWRGGGAAALNADDRSFLLRIARESVEHVVRTGRPLPSRHFAASAPQATRAKRGAFVTLNDKATGALRGCIGEILPMRPLVEAVTVRAADAARRDPRFTPVPESELAAIRVEVSALTPPQPVGSWRDIVLGRDGITLEKGEAFAVFLPQVAPEQGWDLATTLSYLAVKAGLPPDAWQSGAKFETFRAEVFHE